VLAESPIDGDGIATLEVFDYHVQRLDHHVSYRSMTLLGECPASSEGGSRLWIDIIDLACRMSPTASASESFFRAGTSTPPPSGAF
jgi:hypothetical protein